MSNLEQAVRWRQEGKVQEAIELLQEITVQEPENANVWYQLAWAHDSLGLEREAVPHYEKALSLGLSGEERAGAILGLGSTYRTLGEYNQAKIWFEKGMNEFTTYREFEVFYAMVLYNLGNMQKRCNGCSCNLRIHQVIRESMTIIGQSVTTQISWIGCGNSSNFNT